MPLETERVHIGIDPGASGGIAVACGDLTLTQRMVEDRGIIWDFIRLCSANVDVYAVIEKVGGYLPNKTRDAEGKLSQPGSSMFRFGQSYGELLMALTAAGIERVEECPPRRWQKEFGMSKEKGESQSRWKGRLKERAQELFPQVKVTLALADALLIAEYCRRKYA